MKLNIVAKYLSCYYKNASEAVQIIMNCALVAAGATAVGGMFPFLALPSMIISCFGAVWTMYLKICLCLNIPIGENILKVLASAALSNIASNLVGVFAVELITAAIPGMMFMEMLLAFAKKGTVGSDLGNVTQKDFQSEIKKHTPTREDVKDTRNVFDQNYSKV